MIGSTHSHLSIPALAIGILAVFSGPGCSTEHPPAGGDFANGKPVYEQDTDIKPTAVASCLDDNPNPPAGCL